MKNRVSSTFDRPLNGGEMSLFLKHAVENRPQPGSWIGGYHPFLLGQWLKLGVITRNSEGNLVPAPVPVPVMPVCRYERQSLLCGIPC